MKPAQQHSKQPGARHERDPVTPAGAISTPTSRAPSDAGENDPPPDEPGHGTPTRAPAGASSTLENDGEAAALEPAVNDQRIAANKGYHKARCIRELKEAAYHTVIPERAGRGKRTWRHKGGRSTAVAVHQAAWRTQQALGKR